MQNLDSPGRNKKEDGYRQIMGRENIFVVGYNDELYGSVYNVVYILRNVRRLPYNNMNGRHTSRDKQQHLTTAINDT